MTLGQFLDYLEKNPLYIIVYLLLIPIAAFLAGVMGKGEGHESPWKYFYSVLVYIVCIPGIFALAFNAYLFLFERQSVMNTKLATQILPIISMIVTLLIIKKNVSLDRIPGFNKMSGLMMMISTIMILMWGANKTRLLIFSYLPIQHLFLIFIVILVVFRFGWSKIIAPSD